MRIERFFISCTLLTISFLLNSCEDVIDVNLNSTDPRIVIEANVVNNINHQLVKISQTKNFDDNNSIVPYANAQVLVKEENGKTYSYKENSPGNYESDFFIGKPGRKYTIEVTANGKVYTAISTMPQPVLLDSLTATEITFFNNKRKYVQVNFADPKNIPNQYNYVVNVNDTVRNAYYVDSDRFNDGKNVVNTVFTADPELKTGDRVTLDFQCIDQHIYRYFFAISQISGNGGPPTAPANPDSNFNNGALGYFSAHTSQMKTVVIK